MKILFIGYSNVFKKRIIPIIDNLEFIDTVCIAKFEDQLWDDSYKIITKPVQLYDNYSDAINNSKSNIAYISTPNNSHYIWAKMTLNAGMHTVIDKPATIYLKETEDLLSIASNKLLLLSESTVYLFHPQFNTVKQLLKQEKSVPKHLTVNFSFPPMNSNNFRYKKELGGGAFLDTSPYAVSIGRFFFDTLPLQAFYIENELLQNGLELSYSLMLKYPSGKSLIGHFGFNTEYINKLNILGDEISISIDRAFTIPDSIENIIDVKTKNKSSNIFSPKGNTFELYLTEVGKSIINKTFDDFYKAIHADAIARELIYYKHIQK
jgi:dTDP-3,4-didehydro-2,6-dideoxy-alpha-D-glucose 3-reductase